MINAQKYRKKKEPNQKATVLLSTSSAAAGAHLHAIYMVARSDHWDSNISVSIISWHSVIVSSVPWLTQSAEDIVWFQWLEGVIRAAMMEHVPCSGDLARGFNLIAVTCS